MELEFYYDFIEEIKLEFSDGVDLSKKLSGYNEFIWKTDNMVITFTYPIDPDYPMPE